MDRKTAGFREIEHTADWELEVWAPDLASLLEQAARGMYSLSGARLDPGIRFNRILEIRGSDPEILLVKFLSELLFLGEQEGLGFDTFRLSLNGDHLSAELAGAPFVLLDKEIKAVTYHRLKIEPVPTGLEARIIFDV
ncbi:MAG: archease [Chloroflexota bacterium]|nr:MAG: archease [Chloroflexota bacterium]